MSAGDRSDKEWTETPVDKVERIWWCGVTGVVVAAIAWLAAVITGTCPDETLMSDIL